jgi:hypothetical protein
MDSALPIERKPNRAERRAEARRAKQRIARIRAAKRSTPETGDDRPMVRWSIGHQQPGRTTRWTHEDNGFKPIVKQHRHISYEMSAH